MDKKSFFPFFINLKNKKVLIIGAGKIAYRKTETLLKCGADIHIVTKEIKEEKFYNLKNIKISLGEFSEKFLEDIFMVVCATDNKELNEKIYKICDEKNILVNNITSKTEMNCRFGSVIDRKNIFWEFQQRETPKKAKELREKLEEIL